MIKAISPLGILRPGPATLVLAFTVLAACAVQAIAEDPSSRNLVCAPALLAPTPPPAPDWDPQSPYERIDDWAGEPSEIDFGIGHLKGSSDFWWGERHVRLPLHADPGDEPWGWFVDGWLVENGSEPVSIGAQGMLETDYESASFIVYEARADGWLRFRYGKPSGDRDGIAWVHRCHLATQGVAVERWEDRFLSGEISPLHFRSDTPHALRARPNEDSRRVIWIANDHHLEPLAFKGEWMQVRVKMPSDYCVAEDEARSRVYDGWIRWRSPEKGPWVYYYTRGC